MENIYKQNQICAPYLINMTMLQWYLFAFGLIFLWIIVEYIIWKSPLYKKMEKYNLSFYGPFLMWRTKKGRDIIERVSKNRKFCKFYGNISLVIVGVAMVTMTGVLVWVATLVVKIPDRAVVEPHMLLGLPGINPIIPLWYGILGLVVAIVIHEFSHGILTRYADVEVKSLGLTFWIIPMGAFMEPDEEKILKIDAKHRTRLFAVGPSSNLLMAGLCALIFSGLIMGAVGPANDGNGIGITTVVLDSPAHGNLTTGTIMVAFNGTPVNTYNDFSLLVQNTTMGQNVTIDTYNKDTGPGSVTVTLANRYDYTDNEEDNGTGYLGVSTRGISTAAFHPFEGADEQGGIVQSMVVYITLPLQRMSPISEETSVFYEISGFWSNVPEPLFWVISNAFYWIFWLNLMVGLTNALPAVPLDGGYIFKDWLAGLVEKIKPNMAEEKRTKAIDGITLFLAFTILFLIIWQIIGPRIL